MLVIAQVVLAIQLPFTLVPLIKATSNRTLMGSFANSLIVQIMAWMSTLLIFLANLMLFAAMVLPSERSHQQSYQLLPRLRDVMLSWTSVSWLRLLSGSLLFLVTGLGIALLIWMLMTPISYAERIDSPVVVTVQHLVAQDAKQAAADLEEIVLREDTRTCRLAFLDEKKFGKAARKAFAIKLDEFWSQFYDSYGKAISSTEASERDESIRHCLLSIHNLENASEVLSLSEASPWDIVDQAILSLLHVALTDLPASEHLYPWKCKQCHMEVSDPSAIELVTAAERDPQDSKEMFLFGLWSLRQLLRLCSSEPRPELWGKYSGVLNRLQWLLPHIPCNVNRTEITTDDVLYLLQILQQHIQAKKGAKDTLPAATAFPKVRTDDLCLNRLRWKLPQGKEIVMSVIKRYRRALKRSPSAASSGAARFGAGIGLLHFLFCLVDIDNATT